MTITHENTGGKDIKSTQGFMEDIINALEIAGVKDPSVARKVAESLSTGGDGKQRKKFSDAESSLSELFPYGIEPQISDNAKIVLAKRYLLKNDQGEIIEDAAGMFLRVAKAIASVEPQYKTDGDVDYWVERFYRSMARLEFIPNSPTLMNAGTGAGTLSACFVIGLEDSMEGIMDTAKEAALVQKFGGGTGFALSKIRPKGSSISTTHGRACGPIEVLRHLSSVSTLVTQGGKRDGANMAVMDVHHPDIMEFITCKHQEGTIHNFNISVGASEEFMRAVASRSDYDLKDPGTGEVISKLNAADVFDQIISGAWRNGEPGMIFLDRVNEDNPTLHIGRMTATNPCGEQPLLPYESCNLGSINLAAFVIQTDIGKDIDWERLGDVVHTTTRFLDNVIDANRYSVPEIERMTKLTRKTGLGVMGFADMLVNLGISYSSEAGIELGRSVMKFIRDEADKTSEDLAEERGVFPAYEGSTYQLKGRLMRNACRLTVAPTGTISMIAGCSSGIEPLFSLCYHKHNILGGESLLYIDANFEAAARDGGFYSDDLMEYLAYGGSIQERMDVPQSIRATFLTSSDISPEYHVRMQAAFQDSVDSGISKTINFPNSATQEDVRTAYLMAWQLGCKGITVYRAGSREAEVLTSGDQMKMGEVLSVDSPHVSSVSPVPEDRPSQVRGITDRVRTGHGNMYITINSRDGNPFEVFSNLGKAGGCDSAQLEAISRLISLGLRSGINTGEIVEQLRGITCCPSWDDGTLVRSAPDAVALVLGKQVQHDHPEIGINGPYSVQQDLLLKGSTNTEGFSMNKSSCPECVGGFLIFQEGCERCPECGYEKCG